MYCLCSNKSFDEILELQEANPVSPDEMIAKYTDCLGGCGSCINALKAEVEMREIVPQPVAPSWEK
jgi:bacterioferritin-associated ferredoxin